MFLTADTGMFAPITALFGILMDSIYLFLTKIGIGNIGLAIVIFTLITRIILYPMTVKQQKSTRLMSIIQPEINAIQKKYEGKKDQISLMNQNQEIREVYEKYGTSMTGGCLQLLIQLPIIFALYRVIINIPAYVNSIRIHYSSIVDAIGGIGAIDTLKQFAVDNKLERILREVKNFEGATFEAQRDFIIDFLYKLNPEQMKLLLNNFSEEVVQVVSNNLNFINNTNSFFGLNIATSPSAYGLSFSPFNIYLLIPLLAFLTQYGSIILMQKANPRNNLNDENNQMQQTMKAMNVTMPIMAMFITYGLATGVGLYWISSSLFMGIQQLIVNYQLSKLDVDEMVKQNIEKVNKKREKKGLSPISEKSVFDIKRMEEKQDREEEKRRKLLEGREEREREAEKFYFENENKDSIFAKVNMVSKYNQKNDKK